MAHHTEQAGFPGIKLLSGMQIRLEARSPTTNAAITGVTANQWAIYGDDVSDTLLEEVVPLYSLELGAGTV